MENERKSLLTFTQLLCHLAALQATKTCEQQRCERLVCMRGRDEEEVASNSTASAWCVWCVRAVFDCAGARGGLGGTRGGV